MPAERKHDMACWPWIDTLQDDAIREDASRAWYQVVNLVLGNLWGEQSAGLQGEGFWRLWSLSASAIGAEACWSAAGLSALDVLS